MANRMKDLEDMKEEISRMEEKIHSKIVLEDEFDLKKYFSRFPNNKFYNFEKGRFERISQMTPCLSGLHVYTLSTDGSYELNHYKIELEDGLPKIMKEREPSRINFESLIENRELDNFLYQGKGFMKEIYGLEEKNLVDEYFLNPN